MKPGTQPKVDKAKEILQGIMDAAKAELANLGITAPGAVSFDENNYELSFELTKIKNDAFVKKLKEALTIAGLNFKEESGKIIVKHSIDKDEVKKNGVKNLNTLLSTSAEIVTFFKNGFKLVPENDSLLKLATSVAKSSLYLSTPEDQTPPEPGQRGKMKITRTLAGQLTVDTKEVPVLQGKGYPYKIDPKDENPVQGLTSAPYIKDKRGKPLFYATMAPDQFYVDTPLSLPDHVVDDLKNKFNIVDDSVIQQIKALKYHSFSDITDKLGVMLKVPPTEGAKLDSILVPVKKQIATEHFKAISSKIGNYAVISIGAEKGSEHIGYDLLGKNPKSVSGNTVEGHKKDEKIPTLAHYETPVDGISKLLVVQSDRKLNGVNSKMPLFGMDMEHVIAFYDETLAKGIPVAVHCTDGIDRTGIMMVGMVMLHEFRNGTDISALPENEQRQKLREIIDNLREARGHSFLRQEHDILRAVMMGFDLIATQKQLNFQNDNKDKATDDNLKTLLEAHNRNPEELKTALEKLLPTLVGEDVSIANQFLEIVKSRISVDNQFMLSNVESASYSKELKAAQPLNKPAASKDELSKKPLYDIESAPISVYNKLMNDGFDLGSFVSPKGLTIYHYATNTFMREPTLANLTELGSLLEKGRINAQKLVGEALGFGGYDSRIVGMAMQIVRDQKEGVKAVKSELSTLNTEQRKELKAQIDMISKNADPDLKKIFKQLKGALPSASQAKKNDTKVTEHKKKNLGRKLMRKVGIGRASKSSSAPSAEQQSTLALRSAVHHTIQVAPERKMSSPSEDMEALAVRIKDEIKKCNAKTGNEEWLRTKIVELMNYPKALEEKKKELLSDIYHLIDQSSLNTKAQIIQSFINTGYAPSKPSLGAGPVSPSPFVAGRVTQTQEAPLDTRETVYEPVVLPTSSESEEDKYKREKQEQETALKELIKKGVEFNFEDYKLVIPQEFTMDIVLGDDKDLQKALFEHPTTKPYFVSQNIPENTEEDELTAMLKDLEGSGVKGDDTYLADLQSTAQKLQNPRSSQQPDKRKSVLFDTHSHLPPKTPVEQLDLILKELREFQSTSQVKLMKVINEIEQIKSGKGSPEEKVKEALKKVEAAGFNDALKEGKPKEDKRHSLK